MIPPSPEFARNRLDDAFAALGFGRAGSGGLGPELVPAFRDWAATGDGITVDDNGIHFRNAANIATAECSAPIEDGGIYMVTFHVANVAPPNDGTVQLLLFGANANNIGLSHYIALADGAYTQFIICNAAGAAASRAIRVRCNGSNGNNNFDVTSLSVRRVP